MICVLQGFTEVLGPLVAGGRRENSLSIFVVMQWPPLLLASFPGSHPEREREPGNTGGVKPWTSSGWVLAVPVRLQNDSRDKFATTASNVATPFDVIVRKSHYNHGIQQGISSDRRETLLSWVWQGCRAKKKNGKCRSQSLA